MLISVLYSFLGKESLRSILKRKSVLTMYFHDEKGSTLELESEADRVNG